MLSIVCSLRVMLTSHSARWNRRDARPYTRVRYCSPISFSAFVTCSNRMAESSCSWASSRRSDPYRLGTRSADQRLIEIAHLQELGVGELDHGAHVLALRIEQQGHVGIDERGVVGTKRQPGRGGVGDLLLRQAMPLGPQDLRDRVRVLGGQRSRVARRRESLHLENRVVLNEVGDV